MTLARPYLRLPSIQPRPGMPPRPDLAPPARADGALKVVSWNLLRRIGATVRDVIELIHAEQPDLLLMQEATVDIDTLPTLGRGALRTLPPARPYPRAGMLESAPLPPPAADLHPARRHADPPRGAGGGMRAAGGGQCPPISRAAT